ncbi:UNVERIFIED_CONTAM: hypothetical protein Sradi_2044800 [Sesamum radiatum]|uniref:RNase H type-1 domain-containing protein n=1 Tax=Sesamum radiatum TaxID=300843 RepID=A0AAW2THM6_SESRA
MEFAVKFEFKASNSETEYKALVLGMRMAQNAGVSHLLAYSDSLLIVKYLSQEEGLHILKEIHEGCCRSHIGTWALANQALRAGYFWLTMKQDARHLVNKCMKCQKHVTLIHQPIEPLNGMLSPYPFSQWGMDIVGPFPLELGQMKSSGLPSTISQSGCKQSPLPVSQKGKS